MQKELVSIIMPSYNSTYIVDSIEAILAQTYDNWELLITDDCSVDQTRDIIKQYVERDSRIELLVLDSNQGAGVARNVSISRARGRYIAFCDSDDVWMPEKLERQIKFMQENGYELSFTSYYACSEDLRVRNMIKCQSRVDLFSLVKDCSIGCLTVMYDTTNIGKVDMPTLRRRQDWGLWLMIVQRCEYGYGLKEPLAKYRQRMNSISSNKFALVKYNIGVYRTVLGYSMAKSYLIFFMLFLPLYILKRVKLGIGSIL